MIKEFGMKNFFCFKEGSSVSFKYGKNVPKETSKGKSVGTVLGIKGANGSGKTNIIKALEFIADFISKSADEDVGKKIQVDSFKNSKDPSEFYVEFFTEGMDYIYELKVSPQGVFSEKLWRKSKRKSLVFSRKGNEIDKCISEIDEIKKIKLKENASLISLVKKFNFKSEMTDLNKTQVFFTRVMTNVDYSGLSHSFHEVLDFEYISKKYAENDKAFKFVKDIITASDTGVKDIHIAERKNDKGETIHFPIFIHENSGDDFLLTIYDESSGTQQLYRMLYIYWLAVMTGGVLAIDEFDIHLHSLILPKIIELFNNEDINKNNAQFIFTSHNTEIIDSLGKYRTILVNKESNESYCYRLDELPSGLVRNDRPISPLYMNGKIGGVPKL